jgi:hypothetical protein
MRHPLSGLFDPLLLLPPFHFWPLWITRTLSPIYSDFTDAEITTSKPTGQRAFLLGI